MNFFRSLRFLIVFFIVTNASAYVVDVINVEGNIHVSKDVVVNSIDFTKGVDLNDAQVNEFVKKVYATGLFKDVKVSYADKVLTLKVVEKPILSNINIIGNDDVIKAEELSGLYQKANIEVGRPISTGAVYKLKSYLKGFYNFKGYNGVKIVTETKNLDKYRVELKLDVTLGDKTSMGKLEIIGNKEFSDSELKSKMQLADFNIFSWFIATNYYSKTQLDMDVIALKNFYVSKGYLDSQVAVEKVDFVDDGKYANVVIKVSEGKRFRVSSYEFITKGNVDKNKLQEFVKFKSGDFFSRENIAKTTSDISQYLVNNGYVGSVVKVGFADSNPTKGTIKVVINVFAGKEYRVRNISFSGNYVTDEILLRRSMRQYEGQTYNQLNVEKSEKNLRNFSYIKQAKCDPSVVPDSIFVDINCNILESSSSVLTGKMGYSDMQGFLYGASYSQDNFLGSGNKVVFELNKSQMQADFSVTHFWPYLTEDGISLNTSLFFRETTPNKINISNYNTNNYGARIGFGFPVAENHRLGATLAFEHTELKTFSNSPTQVTDYVASYGNEFNQLNLDLNWSYSDLDRFIFPSSGQKHTATGEVAIPYNDDDDTLSFYRLSYKNTIYQPILAVGDFGDLIFLSSTNLGYGNGLGNQNGDLPWFKNFYAGGLGSVRGYASHSLGPKGTMSNGTTGKSLGGNILLTQSLNLIIPQNFSENVRVSLFADAGNVFEDSIDWDEIRYSAGFQIQWRTPIAPLVFSFGFPIDKHAGDDVDKFAFSLAVGY